MNTRIMLAAKRTVLTLLLGAGLGGCAVYAPPYAAYDPYYSGYAYPTYIAPPVSLNFGFYEHRHRGHHGWHHGHGWRGHGGWGHGHGWGHRHGRRH